MRRRDLVILGVPSSAGAFAAGQERGPAALRDAGLVERLAAGDDVLDLGDLPEFGWRPDREQPRAQHAERVAETAGHVRDEVAGRLAAGFRVLVLGGDCTVGVGTMAGAVAADADPRLVYLDLHPDLNTPDSVPDGALDWMGVAHMLDVDGADDRLAAAGPRRPLLRDDDLVLLGAGPEQCTATERERIAERDLRPIGVGALRSDPGAAARAALERATAGGRRFLVHFDVDTIDFSDVPLSENTGRGIGVGFDAALAALDVLLGHDALLGLTVTELNPHHGASDGSDVGRLALALAWTLRSVT
jgi:arginase